jgi:hypothetical protein
MCHETQSIRRRGESRRGLSPGDQAIDPAREPALGAHMVSPRRGYTHHGIYVGGGRVVQYVGLCRGLRRGPVEEVVVSQFAQGRSIEVRLADSRRFGREEVVRRARSRLGENSYNVITNNCEHLCEWCLHGEHQSYQVGNLLEVKLTHVVPFLVEDELLRPGAVFEKRQDWQPFAITDGRLVTGQNPASSTFAAKGLLNLLGRPAASWTSVELSQGG